MTWFYILIALTIFLMWLGDSKEDKRKFHKQEDEEFEQIKNKLL